MKYTLFLVFSFIGFSQFSYSYDYKRYPGITGKAVAVGSDTMANMMELWVKQFEEIYPQISIDVDATGSSTAPPALIEGVANIGAMSRPMKPSEVSAFERRYGYPPTVLKIALDAIAIFVERHNPTEGLTVQQIDALFSSTRFCGAKRSITSWEQLGITVDSDDQRIHLYGRNSVSGTHETFKLAALCDGDFKNSINEQPGSSSVILSVASSRSAIGYAAIGYKTAAVRALSVGYSNTSLIPLTLETVRSGKYPFSRFLYLIVNKKPDQPLPILEREFLKFVLSTQGQAIVLRDGYFTIPESLALEQLNVLDE